MAPKPKPLHERFWSKVAAVNDNGCMLWTASLNSYGYGQFSFGRGVNRQAHRVAYELLGGVIPEGFQLDHLCRVRNCVNPQHLEPVTLEENVRRGNALRKLDTTCRNGHPYTGATTYLWKGQRYCRTCRAEYQRGYQRRG
jgi:hypothetical protein